MAASRRSQRVRFRPDTPKSGVLPLDGGVRGALNFQLPDLSLCGVGVSDACLTDMASSLFVQSSVRPSTAALYQPGTEAHAPLGNCASVMPFWHYRHAPPDTSPPHG